MVAVASSDNQGILLASATITPAVKAPKGVVGTIYIQERAVVLLDLRIA